MSADSLELSMLQRPVWDTERRSGETRNPDSPSFSLPPPSQRQKDYGTQGCDTAFEALTLSHGDEYQGWD